VVRGQGLALADPRRAALLSGELGRLWCLPLWLSPHALPRRKVARVERWAVAWATTIQPHWDLVESAPGAPRDAAAARLAACRRAALQVWPTYAPFRPGDPFGPEIAALSSTLTA
jgi:hypothetical protein